MCYWPERVNSVSFWVKSDRVIFKQGTFQVFRLYWESDRSVANWLALSRASSAAFPRSGLTAGVYRKRTSLGEAMIGAVDHSQSSPTLRSNRAIQADRREAG